MTHGRGEEKGERQGQGTDRWRQNGSPFSPPCPPHASVWEMSRWGREHETLAERRPPHTFGVSER